ncbi:MAG: M20/M25/M40 family metallo-hydrolase [Candidatus Thorarchaeota archaeon]|nr:M20/M25/M40 family metallo-hydrolase [Candidatus Thorarchaeota archaeon]
MSNPILDYLEKHLDDAIADLRDLCSIPSVAAKGEHIDEAAQKVMHLLESVGLETSIHQTSGSPVVTGEIDIGANKTLLFYNHYDVQPAEPFDLWETPPFEMNRRDGRLYGRGVADNKGDLITRVWALKAFQETNTNLPVNIKFLAEGEEEIGSPHLNEFVKENRDFLRADGGIWEFGSTDIDGNQEMWLGLKGLLYVQLEIERLAMDAHSSYACMLPSAVYRLVWALNSLRNEDNQILIDGFYDDVKPLSKAEQKAIENINMHEKDVREFYDIPEFLDGMRGIELKKAFYNAPTCNIAGIDSGWQGSGAKTVLPAKALVKIDFRLVESMRPEDILRKLRNHLDRKGFTDIRIAWNHGYPAAKTPIGHPFVDIVRKATEQAFGHGPVVHPTSPGSGPLYLFKGLVPMVSVGCGDFESRVHSPNESILVDNFLKASQRIVAVIQQMEQETF